MIITNLNIEHSVEVMDDHMSIFHSSSGVFNCTHADCVVYKSWVWQGA